jgi:hypothetical protein
VLTAAKPFLIFPVIRHLSEVCILSDCGKVRTAIRIITMRHSLPPTSSARIPFVHLTVSYLSAEEEYGLTVFRRFNDLLMMT